jgi:Fic family protein
MKSNLLPLPLDQDLETKKVLKSLVKAHKALAELKGIVEGFPNYPILINTLSLQEAKDSSAIENIITTHDDLYQSDVKNRKFKTLATKEVYNYSDALIFGFEEVKETTLILNKTILDIQSILEENNAGYRKQSGTVLKNDLTGETIYTPPQNYDDIISLMGDLEKFINDNEISDFDPLIKMAIIHHQFESIHPFYDGNGRTGRILNILYLVKEGILDYPVLYLSRYINNNKQKYYQLLQDTRKKDSWEEWILYILEPVEETSIQTIKLISDIKNLMQEFKIKIRTEKEKIYSHELLNNLFRHPYTKIDFVVDELGINRKTASKYLEDLVSIGILSKHKLGKDNYYLNDSLFKLLSNVSKNLN